MHLTVETGKELPLRVWLSKPIHLLIFFLCFPLIHSSCVGIQTFHILVNSHKKGRDNIRNGNVKCEWGISRNRCQSSQVSGQGVDTISSCSRPGPDFLVVTLDLVCKSILVILLFIHLFTLCANGSLGFLFQQLPSSTVSIWWKIQRLSLGLFLEVSKH